MSSLDIESRQRLLALARRAIEAALQARPMVSVPPAEVFQVRQGAFVTLWQAGRLRGCIGQVEPLYPRGEVIVHCAVAAATRDPRFSPLTLVELNEVEIEISLLSPLSPARPEDIVVGRHGVLVSWGVHRGVFLPEVASEHGWSVERLLSEACRKAGLPPAQWRHPDTRIEVFTTESFRERTGVPQSAPEPRAGEVR